MSSFKNGKFDMVISQWVGFTGPEMLRFVFHSENVPPKGGNRISFLNKDFDKAVDLATVELDPAKRIELYKSAEEIVDKQYAYLNLWHPNVVWVGKSCLGNIVLEPNASFIPMLKMEPKCGK
jgi:peptide/nickel transport system substrate-binding protein